MDELNSRQAPLAEVYAGPPLAVVHWVWPVMLPAITETMPVEIFSSRMSPRVASIQKRFPWGSVARPPGL
jgi:hypothetical protein